MELKVFILTGAIQTGKTTSLLQWVEGKQCVYGILSPVANGKRVFMDISTNERFDIEANGYETDILNVGRFVFSADAFRKARNIIIEAWDNAIASPKHNALIIIDEIGPLELKGQGLHDAIKIILQGMEASLLLVVRDGLVEKVTDFFSIKDAIVIGKEGLHNLREAE